MTEFNEKVRELCREGGMDFVKLHWTAGTNRNATPEQIASEILRVNAEIKADQARPMGERLYDEYLDLFDHMLEIMDMAHEYGSTDLSDPDWMEKWKDPLRQKLNDIVHLADSGVLTCNLIKKEDRLSSKARTAAKRARQAELSKKLNEQHADWFEHIERTL